MFTSTQARSHVEVERIVEHRDTILRIGLVHEDRLISDQAFSGIRSLSIGASKRCDIVLDSDYGGPPVEFFNLCDDSATLRCDVTARIRMASGKKAPANMDALLQRRLAVRDQHEVTVHVPLNSRGRLVMGPYTVLFQVIRRRVRVPMLPGQGVFRRITGAIVKDPAWAACLAMSVCLVGALAAQAIAFQQTTGRYLQDTLPAEQPHHETVFVEVAQLEPPPPKAPAIAPPKIVEKAEDPGKKPQPKPAPKVKKQPRAAKAPSSESPDRRTAARRLPVRSRSIAGAFSSKIFQRVDSGSADLVETAFGAAAEPGGEDAPHVQIVTSSGDGDVEKIATGRPKLKRDGKRIVVTHKPREEKKIDPIELTRSGALPNVQGKDRIARALRKKNRAVQRCYEAALRDNPSIGGKVQVFFTIGTAGTLTSIRVVGASGDFAECLERKFRAIRGLPVLTQPTAFTQSYVFTRR